MSLIYYELCRRSHDPCKENEVGQYAANMLIPNNPFDIGSIY